MFHSYGCMEKSENKLFLFVVKFSRNALFPVCIGRVEIRFFLFLYKWSSYKSFNVIFQHFFDCLSLSLTHSLYLLCFASIQYKSKALCFSLSIFRSLTLSLTKSQNSICMHAFRNGLQMCRRALAT